MESTNKRGLQAILVFSVLFLFFLQLITDFIAGIYGIGLMGTAIPPEIATIMLFLSPFLLLFFKRGLPSWALVVLGELVLLSRALEIVLPTRSQLLVAGIGTSLFLFLFPAILWELGQMRDKGNAKVMTGGLVLAVAASILLRTLGSTMDLSNEEWYWAIAWILAIGSAILLPGVFRFKSSTDLASEADFGEASWLKSIGLGLGITSVFLLLYFAFYNPAVIARWTEADYLLILSVALIALVAFAWSFGAGSRFTKRVSRRGVFLVTAGFTLALTLTLVVNQAALPKEGAGFPYPDPQVRALWIVALLGLLILYPILFLDFGLLTEEAILSRPTMRKLGLGFGLSSLFMLILILANVFTSAWAYVDPILEPLFRNRFWHIHFIISLVLTLSVLIVSKRP